MGMQYRYFLGLFAVKNRGLSLFAACFFLLIPGMVHSQTNMAPDVSAVGDQMYCPQTSIPIATSFNIIDPDDTEIDAFFIQISTGYQRGLDILRLENSHPNVATSWNDQEGKLTLTGPSGSSVAYSDLIAAVNDVVFESSSTSPTEEKYFSFTIGSANYLPETGHYYEYIPDLGIRWDDAVVAAENSSFFGLQGYLATITSDVEAQLTGEQASGTGWIGGTDEATEGQWRWVTGPEAGTVFWNGAGNGSTPNFAFWNTNEPNDLNGEDYAHITDPSLGITGSWNDLPITGGDGIYEPQGYIVEYGGMPGDPTLTLSASTKITTPKISDVVSGTVCGPGTVTLQAASTIGDVLWFDSETGGSPIGSGGSFQTPWLVSNTTFYALASYNGCLSGERVAVEAEVKLKPVINEGFTITNCDSDGTLDGFTDFDLTSYLYLIRTDYVNLDITFYLSESDAENSVNPLPDMLFNNSVASELYFRAEGSGVYCYSVGNLFLDVSTTSLPSNYQYEQQTCDQGAADGIAAFDLGEATNAILSEFPNNQNLSVSFYQNEDDAYLNRNAIMDTDNYSNSTPYTETLFVRVEDEASGTCYGVGPHLKLEVYPIPSFDIGQDYMYCTGQSVLVSPSAANGNHQYEWFDETGQSIGTDATIRIAQQGSYTVVATSEYGCVSEPRLFRVDESGPPELLPQFVQVDDDGESGTITVMHQNGELGLGNYVFSLDDSLNMQEEAVFTNVAPGLHTLYAMDRNGCGIDRISVGVIGVSKFFTPNNDGINDEVKVLGVTEEFYKQGAFFIFDRYGKLLAQRNPIKGGWNGVFNGNALPPTDYWYVLELVDIHGEVHQKKGHFTLKQ